MSHDRLELLDAYLDGMLAGDELAAFEAALAGDAELRGMVDAQRRIDASLRRSIVPRDVPLPEEAGIIEPSRRGFRIGPGAGAGNKIRFALAAVMLLAISGVFYTLMTAPERARGRYQPEEVYAMLVDDGFRPAEVCTDEAQFLDWMTKQHKLAMVIPSNLPGVELVGWRYENVMDYSTSVLMARVNGKPVIVLIEDKDVAQRLAVARSTGLKLFRKNLGTVAMYEVTPLDKPMLIGHATLQ